MHHMRNRGLKGFDHIPTIVFINARDELVSKPGIQQMIQQAHLKNWHLIEVQKKPSKIPNHIIIDEQAVGKEAWQRIVATMTHHLLATDPSGMSHGR